jgi:hypothetical protein
LNRNGGGRGGSVSEGIVTNGTSRCNLEQFIISLSLSSFSLFSLRFTSLLSHSLSLSFNIWYGREEYNLNRKRGHVFFYFLSYNMSVGWFLSVLFSLSLSLDQTGKNRSWREREILKRQKLKQKGIDHWIIG